MIVEEKYAQLKGSTMHDTSIRACLQDSSKFTEELA